MAGPSTWAANALKGAGGGSLADARRKRDLLRAQLEAIRSGKRKVSRTELRRLEHELETAEAEVTRLERAAPVPTVTPRPRLGATPTAGVTTVPTVAPRRPPILPSATTTPTPIIPPAGQAAPGQGPIVPSGVPTPGGTPTVPSTGGQAAGGIGGWIQNLLAGVKGAWAGRPTAQGPGPILGRYQAGGPILGAQAGAAGALPQVGGGQPFGSSIGGLPEHAGAMLSGAMVPGAGGASPVGGVVPRLGAGAGVSSTDAMLQAYIDAQQAAAASAAALEQQKLAQQKEIVQMQLQQAWATAQANLAQAQKEMAANIGIRSSELQGQMWGQGLPYALPRGTGVAPGFEMGGPMQQLHRMSGAQFTPGVTGKISPYPQPSQSQIMQWVKSAMSSFGP